MGKLSTFVDTFRESLTLTQHPQTAVNNAQNENILHVNVDTSGVLKTLPSDHIRAP